MIYIKYGCIFIMGFYFGAKFASNWFMKKLHLMALDAASDEVALEVYKIMERRGHKLAKWIGEIIDSYQRRNQESGNQGSK